jgi:hypothetical protein
MRLGGGLAVRNGAVEQDVAEAEALLQLEQHKLPGTNVTIMKRFPPKNEEQNFGVFSHNAKLYVYNIRLSGKSANFFAPKIGKRRQK